MTDERINYRIIFILIKINSNLTFVKEAIYIDEGNNFITNQVASLAKPIFKNAFSNNLKELKLF
ncbi:hypothetical protein [Miniphocaeibacter halophilus]|uniref:Uncharacterized protein n=1 Tax=Miniphocaeibacter halophilus TaxID=2931922 RepID=A0AC61MPT2_9FIRM|nr:hypothetical protein [Miniphocaeibacter halophilus]QQK07198.1 hypothetical protein JFY71_07665 [Miniphocaeibacter halophilus]